MGSPKLGDRDYNRMKYYSALKTKKTRDEGGLTDEFLDMPEHLISPDLFLVDLFSAITG